MQYPEQPVSEEAVNAGSCNFDPYQLPASPYKQAEEPLEASECNFNPTDR